jgi:hypothetical protein
MVEELTFLVARKVAVDHLDNGKVGVPVEANLRLLRPSFLILSSRRFECY